MHETTAERYTAKASSPRQMHVLIVDDDPDHRLMISRAIRHADGPASLNEAADVEAAWGVLRAGLDAGWPVDRVLVLLDLDVAGTPGLALLDRVRGTRGTQHVPVVVVSSSDEPSDVREAYARGANGFVRKAVRYEDLRRDLGAVVAYWAGTNVAARAE